MKMEQPAEYDSPGRLPEYLSLVLLIDDQPIVGQAVRNIFADQPDIDFHYCPDPHEALTLASELRPTVILQDLVMPGIDGLQLVSMMRENPETSDTPIIVLSSKEDPTIKRDAFAAGANDYLVKLPDKLELVARVRYHSRAHLNRIQRDEAYRALRESQQKLLESNASLYATNQELESATRVKSEFLASMSHEIRTPLSGVIGMTTLLSDTALTKEQSSFVETIRSSGNALLELINDILDFSKIEAGKLEIEKQPFDLIACVEETLDLLAVKAGEKNLALGYTMAPSLPRTLYGDVGRIRQILMNLIGNAVKFTLNGEVCLRIFRPENENGMIQFSVSDTGIGIPRDCHDRLFKSFSQVDGSTTRNFGGTGLGLAISKTLCERMGGRIWLESDAGAGSTFHFTLELGPPAGAMQQEKGPPPGFSGKRVLVIEDKLMHQETLKRRLENLGMAPTMAATREQAIQSIRNGAPLDAVILSSRLSGMATMDTLDVVQQIRAESSTKSIPLILMVPQHVKRLQGEIGEAGVSGCLFQPVREAQLIEEFTSAFQAKIPSLAVERNPLRPDENMASRYPLRILIAEDNPVNQLIAKAFLSKLGYRADVVSNGLEAIMSLERQSYDLVFMDVQMPEMDGLEAARTIRKRWKGRVPRIIAMTANAMEGDREKCIDSGMDDYITKPIVPRELFAILNGLAEQLHRKTVASVNSDRQALLDRVGGDSDLAREIGRTFIVESPKLLARMRSALDAGDAATLQRAAHTYKGSVSIFAVERATRLAADIERKSAAGNLADAGKQLVLLEQYAGRVCEMIDALTGNPACVL